MEGDAGTELAELLAEVRRVDVQSRRLVASVVAGGWHSAFRGAGIEFEEVREYAAGDDPRSVDWNVTARMGRPFVKKYVEEREQTVLFLLDLSASMTGGFAAWSSRQAAARICACLALSATRDGDRVGLVGFGADVSRFVEPRRGQAHALRIVRDCLALPTAPGRTDPAAALRFAARTVRRRAIVFLVSDFLPDASPDGLGWERDLSRCARRHDVVAVRCLAPELTPPRRGLARVEDPETGSAATVDFSDARVREAYGARVARWRERTEEVLARARVDRIDVPLPRVAHSDAIAGPLVRFFRARELRGTKR